MICICAVRSDELLLWINASEHWIRRVSYCVCGTTKVFLMVPRCRSSLQFSRFSSRLYSLFFDSIAILNYCCRAETY